MMLSQRLKHLQKRKAEYNRVMELIDKQEDEGRILVIRPQKPIRVSRMEKDPAKLQELYDEGYAEASKVQSLIK